MFPSPHDLLRAMAALGISFQVMATAEAVMQLAENTSRFLKVADGVQIPFARLQELSIDLFD